MSESRLIKADSETGILVVPQSLYPMAQTIEFISKAYKIAKRLHPTLISIIIVTGSEYDFIQTEDVILHSVDIYRNY